MTKDPVIKEIGKAITETPAMQEYCLFWWDWWPMCMTRGEWSGWMQAIGAVAALAIAIWLSGSPERAEKRDAVAQARAFAKAIVVFVQGMGYAAQMNERGVLVLSIAGLNEIAVLSQSARPERLPKEGMEALMNLKIYVAQVLLIARAFESQPTDKNSADFQKLISHFAPLMKSSVDVLHKKQNGVSAEQFDATASADQFIAAARNMRAAAQESTSSKI